MRQLLRAISHLGCILAFTSIAAAQWLQTAGPEGGFVQCLAGNGSAVFAGTYGGGAFVSTNGGVTWSVANAGLNNGFLN